MLNTKSGRTSAIRWERRTLEHVARAEYRGVDRPHAMVRGSQAYYYATDYPGNMVGLIDGIGSAANEYRYDAWGARESARVSA